MRILLIAPEFPPAVGGMAAYAGQISERLTMRGHAIWVLTKHGPAESSEERGTIRRVLTGRYLSDVQRIRAAIADCGAEIVLLANAGFAGLAAELEIQ